GDPPGSGIKGCGGITYTTRYMWDRGLSAALEVKDPRGAQTTMTYDQFGRPLEVREPDPATGAAVAEPALRFSYFAAQGGPVQRARVESRVGSGVWRVVWAYTDGLGAPLLTLEQADPAAGDGGEWLVAGLPITDGLGSVGVVYEPWFYSGDPAAHPLNE